MKHNLNVELNYLKEHINLWKKDITEKYGKSVENIPLTNESFTKWSVDEILRCSYVSLGVCHEYF
jgi:hypothetical protein